MGKPGGLPSMGSHRVGQDWSDLAAAVAAGHGSNLDVHQQMNGPGSCGIYTQWNITQL